MFLTRLPKACLPKLFQEHLMVASKERFRRRSWATLSSAKSDRYVYLT